MSEHHIHPYPSSPVANGSLFHHKTWEQTWTSPEFPPDESVQAREKRFEEKVWWDTRDFNIKFLQRYAFGDRSWPWGYFIYRTTYASDEDWTAGLVKLEQWFDSTVRSLRHEGAAGKLIAEGFQNVLVEDKDCLDGASVDTVLVRHRNWVETHGLSTYANPRFGCCLMIDEQCLCSILASRDPYKDPTGAPMGYINILDIDHDPAAEDYDEGPFYDGCMRLALDSFAVYAFECEDRQLCEQYRYIDMPGWTVYTTGYDARIGPKNWVTYTTELRSAWECKRTPVELVEDDSLAYLLEQIRDSAEGTYIQS